MDFNFHNVARLQEAGRLVGAGNTCGRAGGDDVAGFQRHHAGQEFDQVCDGKDHRGGGAVLDHVAIDAGLDGKVLKVAQIIDCH